MKRLEEQLNYVRDKEKQRSRHRDVQNDSPFKVKDDEKRQVMLDSVDFSIKRSPLKIKPEDTIVPEFQKIPAGTVSNFGKQLLLLEKEGGSKANVARKAKLITSIQIGEPSQTIQYTKPVFSPEDDPNELLP